MHTRPDCWNLVALSLTAVSLGACSVSRHEQVRAHSQHVERALVVERDRVLADNAVGIRDTRLSHLSTLRVSLSAANIALGTVPWTVASEKRPTAYDVLDEVYGTIEWNIPLGAGQALRPMPRQFQGNVLTLD